MDSELLIALIVLWWGTTSALISFLGMWFFNEGEAFHPHSVDIENRHSLFAVVSTTTVCKSDCVVKSISSFVAPRGSSSSKLFTVFIVIASIAGMLGSARWFYVDDATFIQGVLSFAGFAAILLAAFFEWDVVPERFLEDKLLVTGWLIEKLGMDSLLPFPLDPTNKHFVNFIRNSPEIYPLYEEDIYIRRRGNVYNNYHAIWHSVHTIGALAYVGLIPTAILMNDEAEAKVVWITASFFCFFCLLGYLSGNYLPVFRFCRGWIMIWNPFVKEPHFMYKLKRAIDNYVLRNGNLTPLSPATQAEIKKQDDEVAEIKRQLSQSEDSDSGQQGVGLIHRKSRGKKGKGKGKMAVDTAATPSAKAADNRTSENMTALDSFGSFPSVHVPEQTADNLNGLHGLSAHRPHETALQRAPSDDISLLLSQKLHTREFSTDEADALDAKVLDSFFLRFARKYPADYLRIAGHLMVMTELIAMLTPSVAMGIQWVTALCDGPPLLAIIDLLLMGFNCVVHGKCVFEDGDNHCIIKSN